VICRLRGGGATVLAVTVTAMVAVLIDRTPSTTSQYISVERRQSRGRTRLGAEPVGRRDETGERAGARCRGLRSAAQINRFKGRVLIRLPPASGRAYCALL
jgi:hypothetical protein